MRAQDSFDEFYAATYRRTLHQMYGLLADLAEAQDVTQEAYVRAWRDWSSVSDMADPQAWVRTVGWRLGADRLRHLRRAARQALLRRTPAPALAPSVATVALVAALKQLPADQRQVLVLHYLVDLPLAEVATEVGASMSAVKSRLARGRAALLPLMHDGYPEENYV